MRSVGGCLSYPHFTALVQASPALTSDKQLTQQLLLAVPLLAAGPLAIGISFVAAGLAAANLLLDMDWIEKASYQRLPKFMEWYGAQSLMLTLVSVAVACMPDTNVIYSDTMMWLAWFFGTAAGPDAAAP